MISEAMQKTLERRRASGDKMLWLLIEKFPELLIPEFCSDKELTQYEEARAYPVILLADFLYADSFKLVMVLHYLDFCDRHIAENLGVPRDSLAPAVKAAQLAFVKELPLCLRPSPR